MRTTSADKVWSRAALESGGASPGPGLVQPRLFDALGVCWAFDASRPRKSVRALQCHCRQYERLVGQRRENLAEELIQALVVVDPADDRNHVVIPVDVDDVDAVALESH
jgi:hypothetical protein